MTKPTTSSIMAAPVSTTPKRELVRPLVPRTVNVVPRLVAHSAAPAVKACRGVAPAKLCKAKESAIGTPMPVTAIPIDKKMFALRDRKDVERPPVEYLNILKWPDNIDQHLRFDILPSYTRSKRPK